MRSVTNAQEYFSLFPVQTRKLLKELRAAIRKTAPEAEEVISYGMPAFKLGKMLLYYAAFTAHIGFYPMPSAIKKFAKEIAAYKHAKGSVQFPLDKPLPIALIEKMVKFRVQENLLDLENKKASFRAKRKS
jgi:uncharacterized protein YdhG (YjbR/CyaY superfamily)